MASEQEEFKRGKEKETKEERILVDGEIAC